MVDNESINLLRKHVSIRKYAGSVDEEDLKIILETARRAPTAWNLANVHILVVRDRIKKEKIAGYVGGQQHVKEAPVLLVYSIDYEKLDKTAGILGIEKAYPGISGLLEAGINAGIMASWTAIAAEALGYGVSFIALYYDPCSIAEVLGLEKHMMPIVGLTIGKPGETPPLRYRQPSYSIYSIDCLTPAEKRADGLIELYQKIYGSREKVAETLQMILLKWGPESTKNILDCMKKKDFGLK